MTDLIKRLRNKATAHLPGGYKLCAEAADALEQMERDFYDCPYIDQDPARCDLCALDWLRQEATP